MITTVLRRLADFLDRSPESEDEAIEGRASDFQLLRPADIGGTAALLLDPVETMETEYKSWLDLNNPRDRATLAVSAIAITNHGGGTIILGWGEDERGVIIPAVDRPPQGQLSAYSPDNINDLINSFATPNFQSTVRWRPSPVDGKEYLIVELPRNFPTPVRSMKNGPLDNGRPFKIQKNCFYVRRPKPETVLASGEELDALLNRCMAARRV